jgi:hypothetical protein
MATWHDLRVPNYRILVGGTDITNAIAGFNFAHPIEEPYSPLIWSGTIEIKPARGASALGFEYFNDEINPQRWAAGRSPIDVYFNNQLWQRFRVKPVGYRFDQDTGAAVIEITDLLGLLDSYVPAQDVPEFKIGANISTGWVAKKLVERAIAIMKEGNANFDLEVPLPPFNDIIRTPRTFRGSWIRQAQKFAGERGYWLWCDKEQLKWAKYPINGDGQIIFSRPRSSFKKANRNEGIEAYLSDMTITATNEDLDECKDQYPKFSYTYAADNFVTGSFPDVDPSNAYYLLVKKTVIDRDDIPTRPYRTRWEDYKKESQQLKLFMNGKIPPIKNPVPASVLIANGKQTAAQKTAFLQSRFNGKVWIDTLYERVIEIWEDGLLTDINPPKLLKRIVERYQPLLDAQALSWLEPNQWWQEFNMYSSNNIVYLAERVTTDYTYRRIQRPDLIIPQGRILYEIDTVTEYQEKRNNFLKKNLSSYYFTVALTPAKKVITTYTKECLTRWAVEVATFENLFTTNYGEGYLVQTGIDRFTTNSIPDITYKPSPYSIWQKPLIGKSQVYFNALTPFLQSHGYETAQTLTTNELCQQYATFLLKLRFQRYYSYLFASGFDYIIASGQGWESRGADAQNYEPFQMFQAFKGVFIRSRFTLSSNNRECIAEYIGNKVANTFIPEPYLPPPPILVGALNLSPIASQSITLGTAYNLTLNVGGGIAPYTIEADGLPDGLEIRDNLIYGVPTTLGDFTVTITVTDSALSTVTRIFDITVTAVETADIVSEVINVKASLGIDSSITVLSGLEYNPTVKAILPISAGVTILDEVNVTATLGINATIEIVPSLTAILNIYASVSIDGGGT